jgi:2-amino-4-hydroxy-6-hydroxymethyldihydropteridine diphosphokinase
MKHTAYLGLGSNLGDRRANLEQALWRLQAPDLRVIQVSSVYESAPVGPVPDQPAFENAAAHVRTDLTPRELLSRCLKVEAELGRVRRVAQGPRCIDVDLLLVDDLVASWPELELPHPELTRRAFVLAPLMEIAPLATDPRDGALLCCQIGALLRSQSILRVGRLDIFGARASRVGGGRAKQALVF